MIRGRIYRADSGTCILEQVQRTTNMLERMRGLLWRPRLEPDEGLLLAPCSSVHTIGMGYPLDLIYLSAEWRAVKLVDRLPPWRLSACPGARMVLEAAPGFIRLTGLEAGIPLRWETVA